MIFILKKVWIFFVTAVVLLPCLVEGFNFIRGEMFPESMNGISVLGELLAKKSYKVKEIWMAPIIHNPLFGWLKNSDEFLASCIKVISGFNTAFASDVPALKDEVASTNDESSRGNDNGSYDWCFHYAMYLAFFIIVWISCKSVWDNNSHKRNNQQDQIRILFGIRCFLIAFLSLIAPTVHKFIDSVSYFPYNCKKF